MFPVLKPNYNSQASDDVQQFEMKTILRKTSSYCYRDITRIT